MPLPYLAAAVLAVSSLPVAPAAASPNPLALYGEEIQFEIQRKGKPVGTHVVRFSRDGETIRAHSEVRIAVEFLFFTAFRYVYDSHAVWSGNQLQALDVKINDNGSRKSLSAARRGDELMIAANGVSFAVPPSMHPTEHWAADIVNQGYVLNTLTGKVNRVTVAPRPREYVTTDVGPVAATPYAYSGDLAIQVWYDDEGRWVKMRFKGRDGSEIEYVCRRCQGQGA